MREYLWGVLVRVYPAWLRRIYKMDLAPGVVISWKATLDKSINPRGIHIGEYTWVLSRATILSHDHCRRLKTDTYIGKRCIIGIIRSLCRGYVLGIRVWRKRQCCDQRCSGSLCSGRKSGKNY